MQRSTAVCRAGRQVPPPFIRRLHFTTLSVHECVGAVLCVQFCFFLLLLLLLSSVIAIIKRCPVAVSLLLRHDPRAPQKCPLLLPQGSSGVWRLKALFYNPLRSAACEVAKSVAARLLLLRFAGTVKVAFLLLLIILRNPKCNTQR